MARISVAGGGIAGLALAATLDRGRHDVTIYEERPNRPPAGTGLGMWPSAMRALDAIGLGDTVRDASLDIRAGSIRDRDDRPIVSQEVDQAHLIARPELLAILGGAAKHVEHEERRVEDDRQIPADVVVAADGVHSAVRRSAYGPRARSRAAGVAIFRGVAEGCEVQNASEFWDAGTIGGLMPLRGERRNWYLAIRTPPELSEVNTLGEELRKEHALRYAARLPDRLSQAIADTADSELLYQHLWVSPTIVRLYRGRVVLIGDAAHAMTPNLGRGACEAIVDAVTLGTELNRHDIPTALRRYAARRAIPTLAIKGASRAALSLSTARHGTKVRDRTLGFLSSRR